jgi:hypothetical protein
MTQEKINGLPDLYLDFKKFKGGEEVYHHREEGHSWVRNAYNLMFSVMADAGGDDSNLFGAGQMSAKVTTGGIAHSSSGVPYRLSGNTTGTGFVHTQTNNSYGIQVGTGNAAFSAEQNVLDALVPYGSGAGQLFYGLMGATSCVYDSQTKTWTAKIQRIFENTSGGSITIAEVGLTWYGYMFKAANTYLMARDVLGTPVVLADGEVLRVTYEISMDFSVID